jgi:hypothetical protein
MTCIALPCWVSRLLCRRFSLAILRVSTGLFSASRRVWRDLAWLTGLTLVVVPVAMADSPRVFRCGNVYTNQPAPHQNCKPLTGGNVTVIEGTQVQTSTSSGSAVSPDAPSSAAVVSANKVEPQAQRQRDVQAGLLLQTELQKAQMRHAELLRLWRNGEPERQADEQRQPQKYQERVAQLRAALQRSEADVAGLQRELARLPATSVGTTTP